MALTKKETNKALDNSIKQGFFSGAKNGFSEYYIVPLALFLGASSEMIGLLGSLPQFLGTIAQPISIKIINKYRNIRILTLFFATLHRLMWVPILLVTAFIGAGNLAIWIILILFSLRTFFGYMNATTWTSWMLDLVPERIRGRHFGERDSLINIAFLISVVVAGLILNYFNSATGFVIIFSISLLFSFLSMVYFVKIPNVKMVEKHKKFHFSFKHFIRGVKEHKNHSNFVFFMVLMKLSFSVVGVFLTVYLLRDLEIGYFWFSIMSGAYIISLSIFQRYWGKFSDKHGHRKTLKITYILTPLVPLVLLFISPNLNMMTILAMLLILRIFDGFIFAGFNLSAFNYLLESVPKEKGYIFVANYRFLAGLAVTISLLMGGILGQYFDGMTFLWMSGLQLLFLTSMISAIVLPMLFLPRFHSIIHTKPVKYKKLFVKAVTIYPLKELSHELTMLVHYLHKMEKKLKKSSRR